VSEVPAPAHHDGLVLLANASMRARRRPLAIAAMWLWTSLTALVAAWPAISVVRGAYGNHPRGDAPLWNAGAFELLDLLANARHATTAVIAAALAVMLASAVIGLVPSAGLIASIAFATRLKRAPPLREALVRGVRAFRPMLVVFVAIGAVEIVVLGVGFIVGGLAASGLEARLGEARAQQIEWLVVGIFALVVAFTGMVGDLARTSVVRFRVGGLYALRLALDAARRGPAVALWSWAWRAIAATALVVIGAIVADKLGGRGGLALAALALIHQAIVGARVALRASWLAKALRIVDDAHHVYHPNRDEALPE